MSKKDVIALIHGPLDMTREEAESVLEDVEDHQR